MKKEVGKTYLVVIKDFDMPHYDTELGEFENLNDIPKRIQEYLGGVLFQIMTEKKFKDYVEWIFNGKINNTKVKKRYIIYIYERVVYEQYGIKTVKYHLIGDFTEVFQKK